MIEINERYERQKIIKGWDQTKIKNSQVVLIGSDRLSDLIMIDLLSMGFGAIKRIGYSEFFDFEKINPEIRLEQKKGGLSSFHHAEIEISEASIVIDATNNLESKFFSSESSKKQHKKYFSASSTRTSFGISTPQDENLLLFHTEDYDHEQGPVNSMVCSALLSEEIRKTISPLDEDIYFKQYRYKDINEPSALYKKILQIGAGAIGTFTGLACVLLGADLTILDFDTVEETNLNRQFLFYDSVGLKKSAVLAERLKKYQKYKSTITSLDKKIESLVKAPNIDIILSCVDNNEARYYLNRSAAQFGTPIINGGSSLQAGQVMPYFPQKTACLDCQTEFMISKTMKETKKRNSGECFQPSIITTNQTIAGLMMNCLFKGLLEQYEKINYSSGAGIYSQSVNQKCFEMCGVHNG